MSDIHAMSDARIPQIIEKQNKLEALKELGRMYRAGMTKHTAHTEDLQATLNINVTENRKEKDELIKSLELTDDQWRKIEDSVTDPPTP